MLKDSAFIIKAITGPMDQTSASLLLRLHDPNDSAAWLRFLRIYTPIIHQWLSQKRVPAAEVDDVAQDIVIKVCNEMRNGFTYDESLSFRGWLFTISRQLAANYFRDRNRRELVGAFTNDSQAESPIDVFEREEFARAVVHQLLEEVKPEFSEAQFAAFYQFKVAGNSAEVVADKLGISQSAVRVTTFRVMRRIRAIAADMLQE